MRANSSLRLLAWLLAATCPVTAPSSEQEQPAQQQEQPNPPSKAKKVYTNEDFEGPSAAAATKSDMPTAVASPACNELSALAVTEILYHAQGKFFSTERRFEFSSSFKAIPIGEGAVPDPVKAWIEPTRQAVAYGSDTEFGYAGYSFKLLVTGPTGPKKKSFPIGVEARPWRYGETGKTSFYFALKAGNDGIHEAGEDRSATARDRLVAFPGRFAPDACGSAGTGKRPVTESQTPNPSASAAQREWEIYISSLSFRERRKMIASLELVIAESSEGMEEVNDHENPGLREFAGLSQGSFQNSIQKLRDGPPPLPPDGLPPAFTLEEKKLRYYSYYTEEERQQEIARMEADIQSSERAYREKCPNPGWQSLCNSLVKISERDKRDLALLRAAVLLPRGD